MSQNIVFEFKITLKKIFRFPLMDLCLKVYLSFFVDPHKFFKMTRKIFQILDGRRSFVERASMN